MLEHLVDPWSASRRYARCSSPAAARSSRSPTSRTGARSRRSRAAHWPRRPEGIFDATHLRWFTLRDALELLAQGAGLRPTTVVRRGWLPGAARAPTPRPTALSPPDPDVDHVPARDRGVSMLPRACMTELSQDLQGLRRPRPLRRGHRRRHRGGRRPRARPRARRPVRQATARAAGRPRPRHAPVRRPSSPRATATAWSPRARTSWTPGWSAPRCSTGSSARATSTAG